MKQFSIRDIPWLAICLIGLLTMVFAIENTRQPTTADEIDEINSLIDDFQDTYSAKDASGLRQLFFADAVIAMDGVEGTRQTVISLDEWIIDTQENVFEENDRISDVLSNREIHVFRNIAYAVCDYNYSNDSKSGRGVDIITFLKKRDRWKIVSLQWTGDEVIR